MQNLDYEPTVYEQIVIDFLSGKELKFENYQNELTLRGWAEQRYFDAYVQDMKFIRRMMTEPKCNLSLAKDLIHENQKVVKKYFAGDENEIFSLLSQGKFFEDERYKAIQKEMEQSPSLALSAFDKDIKLAQRMVENPDFNLRLAADVVKRMHPSKDEDVLCYSLLDSEKDILLEAERRGMFKDGEVIEYDGYKRKITAHDYHKLPENTDAFVIFSGHPGSAEPAVEAWFEDYLRTGKAKKLVFLGLYDNQGNTDFSQGNLQFNTGSEVEMYVRYCRKAGISEEILKECLVTPTDTSTEENTTLLAEIRNKYFPRDKEVHFAMFGYPAYQKRIASEFAFQFQRMEDEGLPNGEKLAPTNFIMPVVEPSMKESERYLSYDKINGVAQDIILGNCLPHPYRVSAGGRFDSKLGEYPAKFKKFLPISLVYSYPNVANELAGTDVDVAAIMKLLRAEQDKVYGWENAKSVDNTIMYNVFHLRRILAHEGKLSAEVAFYGNGQTKKENLRSIAKTKHNYEDEAKIIMGSDNVSPKKMKGMVEYLKRQNKQR